MKLQHAFAIVLSTSTATVSAATHEAQPTAVIYRGLVSLKNQKSSGRSWSIANNQFQASCNYCPESVAHVLEQSPMKFKVVYAGPDEDVDVSEETLKDASVYVQPGGGDLAPAWDELKPYTNVIRDYVASGGRCLGFCLGAYLAGHDKGFQLLPPEQPHGGAADECFQPDAQVNDTRNAVIQVDWQFTTGSTAGTAEDGRWLYFQDGAAMFLPPWDNITVLAFYSSNGDVAAAISPYGKGWVGTVGPHPEADDTWYTYGFSNPDGIRFDIATDFAMATM